MSWTVTGRALRGFALGTWKQNVPFRPGICDFQNGLHLVRCFRSNKGITLNIFNTISAQNQVKLLESKYMRWFHVAYKSDATSKLKGSGITLCFVLIWKLYLVIDTCFPQTSCNLMCPLGNISSHFPKWDVSSRRRSWWGARDNQQTSQRNLRGKTCLVFIHGDMAYRFLSSRIVPSSNRLSRRFIFIFTISLCFMYLCYSILFCSGTIMPSQRWEDHRCVHLKNMGSKKLLQKSHYCTISAKARVLPDETRAVALLNLTGNQSKHSAFQKTQDVVDHNQSNNSNSPKYGNKKLPNALIVGVKKGGTRAVLEFIRIHPDVRALGTEPHFFDRNYDKGLEWYR